MRRGGLEVAGGGTTTNPAFVGRGFGNGEKLGVRILHEGVGDGARGRAARLGELWVFEPTGRRGLSDVDYPILQE